MSTKKTIAKSFTVSTIEDGVSIQAQYAPNANPTSGQIHTVWQEGDLYMRTRESDDAAWSSWHKIVGESGDETDYTFNISKSLTSSNATTAPANCYYSSWQDAPVAPTSTYPYLWMKIVKKTWNESTQSYDSGTARYARITGEPGTSPYFADLNNELDAIQCKHDGSVITDQTVSTVISMWKGSSVEAFVIDNIYRNGTKLTWDGNNNGVWPRVNGSTVSLEFTTSASIADIDDFKITIHSYNDNTVTRELHFTINGVRANAIYRLIPSHSQIVKKRDGTYVPSGNVTCSVEKTENGSTSTPSSSEYTLEKSVNGGSYTTYSATAASSITSDLKFRLKVGGVVVDLETVPLVSDGNKGDTGESAPVAFATPAQISIPCYSNGNVKAQKVTAVIFSLNVGTNTATVTSVSNLTKPTGVVVTGVFSNIVNIKVETTATASRIRAGVTFTVTGTYDGKTYSADVTVALIGSEQGEQGEQGERGEQGARGKIGRFFYYAQEWSNSDTISYTVSDAEAPYFLYNYNYWVFNPTANGTYTMAEMGTPSANSANWQIMYSDFKYIITEAIFGNYAHFGSAIINGDWLLSTHGKRNGNDSTEYTYFDASDPRGISSSSHFAPNFCVDLNTGIAYMNNAFIKGELSGVTGSFKSLNCVNNSGTVVASITFGPDGRLWFEDGDLYNQGTKDGRSLRFYGGDIWCRGAFGARKRTVLLVNGSQGYYYSKGTGNAGQLVSFGSTTSSGGQTYYTIECFGLYGDYSGYPVDEIVFNIETGTYRYQLNMASTQRVLLINANDHHNDVFIYTNGYQERWAGGCVGEVIKLPITFMSPQPSNLVLGRGIVVGAKRDNDWG